MAFMREQIQANASDAWWHQVWLSLLQLQGVFDGYTDHVADGSQLLPFSTLYNLNIGGDMEDLAAALGLQSAAHRPLASPRALHRLAHMARGRRSATASGNDSAAAAEGGEGSSLEDRARRAVLSVDPAGAPLLLGPATEGGGHCSAVVLVLPDLSDVLIAQATWAGFEDMLRVYKAYTFAFTRALGDPRPLPGATAVFSGSPGSIFSGDDWYQLSPSLLVVLETTIGNSNASLYAQFVQPRSVLDWLRNIVANRLAQDGPGWTVAFSRENSGTYNNEFMVLDMKLFVPGGGLTEGLLWVLDQAPGQVAAGDRTDALRRQPDGSGGYFASYNIASFPAIYNVTGMPALEARYGPWFSWAQTARANIFRRDAPRVSDEAGFRRLVRYNDFTRDPLSMQACSGHPPFSAENAVAARDDLNPVDGVYSIGALGHRDHAAIDAKYTGHSLMVRSGRLKATVQAGPTYDTQPAFDWAATSPDIAALPHRGQSAGPWRMPWVTLSWGNASVAGGGPEVDVLSNV